MRHGYSITPALIHQHAFDVLQHCLPWRPVSKSVTLADVLNLLLLMAATAASLFATARRFFRDRFSHQTAAAAVKDQLPSLERLTAGLVQGLHDVACFSHRDRQRAWSLAIDTHYVGYYGRPTPLLVGGPKKQGTKRFFGYATAILLHGHRRYTVGLLTLKKGHKPHQIVRTLLDQVAEKGLKIKRVALDSGFDSGETIRLLQERRLAYVVPLRHFRGGRNDRNRLFEGRHRQIRWTEWKTKSTRQIVRTRTVLWKGKGRTMVFAFDGVSAEGVGDLYENVGPSAAVVPTPLRH